MYQGKKVIGICTSYLNQKYHMRMVSRLCHELSNYDIYVMIFGTLSELYFYNSSDEGEVSIFDLMAYDVLDGLILFPETLKQEHIVSDIVKHASDAGIFVVSIDKEQKGCYNVIYDKESSFEKLVRHVIEYHGLREVNFMAGIEGNEVSDRRIEIYKEVLEDNDILFEEDRIGYGEFWEGPTRKVMERFMDPLKVPPEAIICANDSMAVAVCDYLAEKGFHIPEDIIVTGIDGIEEGVNHSPGITTCVRDDVNDAKKIVEMILDLLEKKAQPNIMELSYHMQLSQSCGCQENYLFNPASVLSQLSTTNATQVADVRYYADMAEEFLKCENMDVFEELVSNYLPDNSFLCINSDLEIGGKEENDHCSMKNAFSTTMRVIMKNQGNTTYTDCESKNVLPVWADFRTYECPVILFPVHFSQKVVGYFGTWYDMDSRTDMERIYHFLYSFNNSAGLKLLRSDKK